MQNITSSKELKEAIQILEVEQAANGQLFKQQLFITLDGLKPVRLIERTLKDVVTSSSVANSLLGATIGLATGYISKKIAVGTSDNVFRKLFGSFLQIGVTNLIARHPEAIKSVGIYVINQIFSKEEDVHEEGE
jgi:hypothetical protein